MTQNGVPTFSDEVARMADVGGVQMDKAIQVVVADDEKPIRRLIAMAIAGAEGITLIGEAADGKKAIELAESLQPDILLLDLNMPELDGLSTARHIRELRPAPRIIVLTAYDDPETRTDAFEQGVKCYLVKGNVSVVEVVTIIRQVATDAEHLLAPRHRAIYWPAQ